MALATWMLVTAIVVFPIGLTAIAWGLHVQALALVQWSHRLMSATPAFTVA